MDDDHLLNSPAACCEELECAVEQKSRRSATELGYRCAQPLTPALFVWHTSCQVPWPPRSASRRRAETDAEIKSIRVSVYLVLPAWCGGSQPRHVSSPSTREVDGDDPRAAPAAASVRPQESWHCSLRFLWFSVQYSASLLLPGLSPASSCACLASRRRCTRKATVYALMHQVAAPYVEGAALRMCGVPVAALAPHRLGRRAGSHFLGCLSLAMTRPLSLFFL